MSINIFTFSSIVLYDAMSYAIQICKLTTLSMDESKCGSYPTCPTELAEPKVLPSPVWLSHQN